MVMYLCKYRRSFRSSYSTCRSWYCHESIWYCSIDCNRYQPWRTARLSDLIWVPGNTERVKETIQLITKLVLLVGIIAFIIFELAPDAVIMLFGSRIRQNIWNMQDCVSVFSLEESYLPAISNQQQLSFNLWATV